MTARQPLGGMTEDQRLRWLRQAYYGLDGRWYLKTRQRYSAEAAQEIDEDVCRSLGRLHLRNWLVLTARQGVADCRVLGRFVLDVLTTLYDDVAAAVRVTRDEPGVWEMQQVRCTIFDMGLAAGAGSTDYAEAVPGALPGCRGVLALYSGWVVAAGQFTVEQRPAAGGTHGVQCRYTFRRISQD